MKKKSRKILILNIIIAVIIILAAVCVTMIILTNLEYKQGEDMYLDLADSYLVFEEEEYPDEYSAPSSEEPEESEESSLLEDTSGGEQGGSPAEKPQTAATTEAPKVTTTAAPVVKKITSVNFSALQKTNKNAIGWIVNDGTPISYPIVRTYSLYDYDYYLTHNFNGKRNKLGTLFTDSRNTPWSDNHTIIYGHNMLNGTMFSSILNYSSQKYYDAHPTMRLFTPDGNYTVKIFSGYMTTVNSDVFTVGYHGKTFENYLASIAAASDFKTDVVPSADDKIITLATCDSNLTRKNNRYVLHGILVKN